MASALPKITKKQGMQILREACPGGSFSDGMMERCTCSQDYWEVIRFICHDVKLVQDAYNRIAVGGGGGSTKSKSKKKSTTKKKGKSNK